MAQQAAEDGGRRRRPAAEARTAARRANARIHVPAAGVTGGASDGRTVGAAMASRSPSVLIVECDLKRHAVVAALLEAFCRVDGVIGVSELAGLKPHRYDLAIINTRAVGVVTVTALVRRLQGERPPTPLIVIASVADAGLLTTAVRAGVVLADPPPVGDFLRCIEHSLSRRRVPRWSQHVVRVVEELCRPGSHTLSVSDLRRRIAVSKGMLGSRFRREVGVNPGAYLTRVATRLATLLLRHTEAKIEEIALAAGFSDGSHLSRVFYRETGRRPGAFRADGRNALPGPAGHAGARTQRLG